jgi:uncharacterized protein YbaR (Trm112 family)
MALSAKLLDVLVCPTCRKPLSYDESKDKLACVNCRVRYQVIEDIPVLLADETEELT